MDICDPVGFPPCAKAIAHPLGAIAPTRQGRAISHNAEWGHCRPIIERALRAYDRWAIATAAAAYAPAESPMPG